MLTLIVISAQGYIDGGLRSRDIAVPQMTMTRHVTTASQLHAFSNNWLP